MNNENSEDVKSVSAGSIVLWLLGIGTIISGLALGNIAVIIAGVIVLPLTNTLVKKYFKINFSGAARVVIALILIIGGTSVSSSLEEAEQAADYSDQEAAQEDVWTEVVTLTGNGNQDTESFNITGKKLRVSATTSGSTVGSYSAIELKKESGGYTGPGLSIMTEGSEQGVGQTTYRNLDSGSYYIQVISGINWEVKVEQTN